jgi:hypothetical protein
MEQYTIKTESKTRIAVECASGARVAYVESDSLVYDKLADTAEMLGDVDHEANLCALGLDAATVIAIHSARGR